MGHPFEKEQVIHKDQGHKEHHEDASLLLFFSSNQDTIDVKNFRAPGQSAGQYNRDKHDQLDLLFVPLGVHNSHTFQSDEVTDQVIACPESAATEPAPCPDRQPLQALQSSQSAQTRPECAPPVPSSAATGDYFAPPIVVHTEKQHRETDNDGSLCAGFCNGYESTSFDHQVRSASGRYAEQTRATKSNDANFLWVVPFSSKDVSDIQWYKETNEPIHWDRR